MTSGRQNRRAWTAIELASAFAGGFVAFALTGMAIVWVVAGIIGGWIVLRYARSRGAETTPNRSIRTTGQVLVGAALGPGLAVQDFSDAGTMLIVVVFSVVAILLASVCVARLYARWSGLDRLTAGLATLPGGLAIMPSVAADQGRDPTLVALVQAARLSVVIFSVPLIAPIFGEARSLPTTVLLQAPSASFGWLFWLGTLAAAPLAFMVARRLNVPVAALLGPMFGSFLITVILRGLGVDPAVLQIPFSQEAVGQVLLGLTVGEYLAQKVRIARRPLLGGLASVLATFVISIAVAVLVYLATDLSFMTSLLMVAPGGAPEMVVVAVAVDAELHLVVLSQTLRQIAVNSLMPLWIKWLSP